MLLARHCCLSGTSIWIRLQCHTFVCPHIASLDSASANPHHRDDHRWEWKPHLTYEIVKYYSIFLFFHVVHFCKRPSQSIFSLASNSSSLVLLCKIWGVSKSLKSFMSAPRIRKDQHQFVENSGSSKWDHYMMRSMQYQMLMLNMCPFGGNGRIMLVHKTKIVTFPIYGYVAHIMCAISSSNTADLRTIKIYGNL